MINLRIMKTLIIIIFSFISTFLEAQTNGKFFLFNKDWSSMQDFDKATYFMQQVKENDTTFTCRYYQKNGPMVKWETYLDSNMTIPNGLFAWYNKRGDLDSIGYTNRGRKNLTWQYGFKPDGAVITAEEYQDGRLVKRINYKTKIISYPSGNEEKLEDPKENKNDVFKKAEFIDGGIDGWVKYVTENLKTPERYISIAGPNSDGYVGVSFEINKMGKVNKIFLYHSAEWSADNEAIRLLNNSPIWIPAEKNGVPTEYNFRQKLIFRVGL